MATRMRSGTMRSSLAPLYGELSATLTYSAKPRDAA